MKYIAIKIKNFNYWIWFDKRNVQEDSSTFIGTGGWGRDGEITDVNIPLNMIEGRIESNNLQYK